MLVKCLKCKRIRCERCSAGSFRAFVLGCIEAVRGYWCCRPDAVLVATGDTQLRAAAVLVLGCWLLVLVWCWLDTGMAIELITDRDPKTGQWLKGHKASNPEVKVVAHHMAKLKAMWLQCVTAEDINTMHREFMKCIVQDENYTVKLAACVELQNRLLGKPDQNINVQSESRTLAANITLTQEQQAVLEQIVNSNTSINDTACNTVSSSSNTVVIEQ